MSGSKCCERIASCLLIILSAFSVILPLCIGIAALFVSKAHVYTLLGSATASAVLSSLVIASVAFLLSRDARNGNKQNVLQYTTAMDGTDQAWCHSQTEKHDCNGVPHSASSADSTRPEKVSALSGRGFLAVFGTVLLGECAPVLILWAFGIAINYEKDPVPIYAYTLTELIIGLLVPTLVVVCVLSATMLVEYSGRNIFGPREVIKYCLPPLAILKCSSRDYWVINDTFYFEMKKSRSENKTWHPMYWKSIVTLGLAAAVTLMLAFFFLTFASISLTFQKVFDSCDEAQGFNTVFANCYTGWNLVNCSFNFSAPYIVCISFKPIEIGSVLGATVASLAAYFGLVTLFDITFVVVEKLLLFKPARFWAMIVMTVGLIIVVFGTTLITVIFVFPFTYKFTSALQFVLLGLFVIVTGVVIGKIKLVKKQDEEVELESIHKSKTRKSTVHGITRRHYTSVVERPGSELPPASGTLDTDKNFKGDAKAF